MDPTPRKAFPGRRPRGRPRAEKPRVEEIVVYCNADEKRTIADRAKEGCFNSVSDYLRSGGLRGWVRRVRTGIVLDQHLGALQALVEWAEHAGNHDLAEPAADSIAQVRAIIRSL